MLPRSCATDGAAMAIPADLFERVAVRWSQVIGAKVTATQVSLCLVDLKLARLVGDPDASRQPS